MRKPLVEVDAGLRDQDKVYITHMVSSTEFYIMKEGLNIINSVYFLYFNIQSV